MSDTEQFVTSPLLFIQPADEHACALEGITRERFEHLAGPVVDVLFFFLDPSTVDTAIARGVGRTAIEAAIQAGLLVRTDNPRLLSAASWEQHRWSRAAYLTFSQLDLNYREPAAESTPLDELIAFRRRSIEHYLGESHYPALRLVDDASPISLTKSVRTHRVDLDAMIRRRSCRSFLPDPISFDLLSSVLHEATEFVRLAAASKESGDPFFLLNSFYSWLNVFIVVQGVEGINRGVFQYDPIAHQLRTVSDGAEDGAIIECIQHQEWIGGGGFCVFVVVQWERYMWLYRHSRAYLNLLIQLGEIGQQIIVAASHHGLGAWMTPAITESRAAALLRLQTDREDAMYFLKIGPPRNRRRK